MSTKRESHDPNLLDPRRGLWQMIPAPVVAGVYFLVCYIATSVYCQLRSDSALRALWLELGLVTLVTLAVIAWCGYVAWRRWRAATDATPERREVVFIARMALQLAVLSWIGVLFVGAPLVFIRSCA